MRCLFRFWTKEEHCIVSELGNCVDGESSFPLRKEFPMVPEGSGAD